MRFENSIVNRNHRSFQMIDILLTLHLSNLTPKNHKLQQFGQFD